MKRKYFLAILPFLCIASTTFAQVIDDSIDKELNKNPSEKQELKVEDFKMKTYSTCSEADAIINKYLELEKNRERRYDYSNKGFLNKSASMAAEERGTTTDSSANSSGKSLSSNDFSKTNTQVSWVDEAEIVKTDGKYIYYFSSKDDYRRSSRSAEEKYIYILSLDKKKIIKKIKIPEDFYQTEFYLSWGKLVLVWNFVSEKIYKERNFYYNNQKSYAIVYDVSDVEKLKIDKFYSIDWNYIESRLIWDKLYLVSRNYFNPYYTNNIPKFSVEESIPRNIDVSKNDSWKFSIKNELSTDCKNIDFILPTEDYVKQNGFSLNYSIISVLDIKNTSTPVKTKIIASNSAELFMNEKNLYLTSNMHFSNSFYCWWCLFDSYSSKDSTLVNKFSLTKDSVEYKKSVLVDWRPLNQYSMDEDKNWNFRILTQIENWNKRDKNYTNLYILDPELKLAWKLEKLWQKENFQSSRYIWDKLFLVTFERVDPLFVIDVKDAKNPKVLWELKIPWYSTYLHPYDENHLIWLGYDTKENKYWWIQNNWIKLDLYQINYDKKCWDKNLTKEEQEKCDKWEYKWIIAKQLFSKSFWESWSYSEALNNPRMFMWNSAKNKLFLPVSLRNNRFDEDSKQENEQTPFIGLLALTINKNTWIKEDFRVSNIDMNKVNEKIKENCKKYETKSEKTCKTLRSGKEICWYQNIWNVPEYCFAWSSVWTYLDNNSWEFINSTVNRALWIGENFYSLSPDRIKANDMNTWKEVLNVELN